MRWPHFLSRKKSYSARDSRRAADVVKARRLVKSARTDAALKAAVSALLLKTGASGAAVALAQGGLFVCRARAGETAPEIGLALSMHSGMTGACARSAKLLYCRDAETDQRVDDALCRKLGIRSILLKPIVVEGVVVGIVEAFSIQPDAFQTAHLKWIEAVADWLGDVCYCVHQYDRGLGAHQPDVEGKLTPATSGSTKDARGKSAVGAGPSPPGSEHQQQDPGLTSFQAILEQMPLASTWEDICQQLAPRLKT